MFVRNVGEKSQIYSCQLLDQAATGTVREVPLLPLHPVTRDQPIKYQCIKVMTPSGWNPPPGHRKLHGDLLYLQVRILYYSNSLSSKLYLGRFCWYYCRAGLLKVNVIRPCESPHWAV
jgi:hypothetical protein